MAQPTRTCLTCQLHKHMDVATGEEIKESVWIIRRARVRAGVLPPARLTHLRAHPPTHCVQTAEETDGRRGGGKLRC
jgi:hypothetical protein